MDTKINVDEILKQLSIKEKITLLSGKNNWETMDFPQYGIPSLFLADGPCGLRKQTGKGDHLGIEDSVPATATVSGGLLAATWNPECARENGRILGREAAAEDVDVLLAPAMNIVRSPLCGRNFEYFSEDPYLTGQIAAAYTEGVQESGVGACPKHFAGNNQETEREYINAVIDERTLREIYLPAFEETIKKARPQAIMSALNQINGEYGAEHTWLLTQILREEWGFDGFTVSDWYGIVHQDKAVAAGMDLEMPCSNGVGAEKIWKSLEEGRLSEEAIHNCCRHLLQAVVDCSGRKEKRVEKEKAELYGENHEKCRKIAEEGIVLLKNEDDILPLHIKEKVAVIGLYAKEPKVTLDGSARVIATACDIPICEMRKFGGDSVAWAQGYTEKNEEDERLVKEALCLAKLCDKVVYFMGQTPGVEMEGHDRESLALPAKQEKLLEQILKVNSNVIVVLTNASAVSMPWKERVKGIFECFLAGQGFGAAIANLLYGKVNPSGKLPVSFTKRLEDTSAYLYYPGNGKEVMYGEGVFVGYRYYDMKHTDLLYPFGYGLSYTTFSYQNLRISKENFTGISDVLSMSVDITNTGSRAGAEVVQLYVGAPAADVKRPVKELKKFKKVYLDPGEKTTVVFSLNYRDFAYYDMDYKDWYAPEGEYRIIAGASSADIRVESSVKITSEKPRLKKLTGWSAMGELKKTPLGKKYYRQIMELLEQYTPQESALFLREDLKNEEKTDQMPLRFTNLLTNGRLDNDCLLMWIDEINQERNQRDRE